VIIALVLATPAMASVFSSAAMENWATIFLSVTLQAFTGTRLSDDSGTTLALRLVDATALSNGVHHLVYGPVEANPLGTYRDASAAMARATASEVGTSAER
jgi:hypothetical protein